MFTLNFQEAYNLDVSAYVKERDGQKYLPWAACKKLLHDHGAEVVMFHPIPGPDGSSLHKSEVEFPATEKAAANRCYEVVVHIQVDDIQWEEVYPVLNGDKPVRDNSMTQLRVHNAIRRAFVKGVAERLGLGFSLWLDEDDIEPVDDLSRHSLYKCKQRLEELITAKLKAANWSLGDLCRKIGRDEDEVRSMMSYYRALAQLEYDITYKT